MMTDPDKIFSKEESCLSFDVMMGYIHDRLSNKERNYVEKHMLQCEFCSEAMDGLSLIEEEKGKDIIESIDETNQMEQQILFAANEINVLEESTADYESVMKSLASAAPAMKRKKEEDAKFLSVSQETTGSKKSFEWRRLAAVLVGALFIGGGLIYLIRNDFNADNTTIAVEKPSTVVPSAKNKSNNDSIIAVGPVPESKAPDNGNIKPNSDGIIYSNDELTAEDKKKDIIQEQDVKDEAFKALPSETIEPAAMSAPVKEETKQEEESIDKLEKQVEDSKVEQYSRKSVSEKKELYNAKGKRDDSRVAAVSKASVASDTIIASERNKVNSDFDNGVALYTKGEYLKAITYFEKLNKKDAHYEEARWYLGKSYSAIGEKEKAKLVFKEIVEINGVFKEQGEEEIKKLE